MVRSTVRPPATESPLTAAKKPLSSAAVHSVAVGGGIGEEHRATEYQARPSTERQEHGRNGIQQGQRDEVDGQPSRHSGVRVSAAEDQMDHVHDHAVPEHPGGGKSEPARRNRDSGPPSTSHTRKAATD
jgi:hypothetical protein